jgi:hypothetical protein
MKFRSKPREIEAEQFHVANGATDHAGVCVGGPQCENPELRDMPPAIKAHLHTMHEGQSVILEDGDWIVPEPDGVHYYPIKPDVMEKNYEPTS